MPKPIQTAHEMMAMLGDEFIEASGDTGGCTGCLAARDEKGVQIIVYNFSEYDAEAEAPAVKCTISVTDMADGEYPVKSAVLDKHHHNTFREWQRMGCPKNVADPVFDEIRDKAELSYEEENAASLNGHMTIKTSLPAQCIKIILIKK